jgi:hypothetical protein
MILQWQQLSLIPKRARQVGLQVKVQQALLGMLRLDHQNQQQQSSSSVSFRSVEGAELHTPLVLWELCPLNTLHAYLFARDLNILLNFQHLFPTHHLVVA